MSTGHLHLFKRSGRYWWRRRLPARLGAALSIAQVRRSLHTAEPSAARRRARRASVAFDEWLATVEKNMTEGRRAPSQDELKHALDDLFAKVLDDGEMARAMRPPGSPDWIVEGPDDPDDPEQVAEAERRWEEAAPSARIADLREQLFLNDCSAVQPHLDAVLRARGLDGLDRTSPQFRLFLREAMRVYIEARRVDALREEKAIYPEDQTDGHALPAPLDTLPAIPALSTATAPRPRRASAVPRLVDEFEAWRETKKGNAWVDKHARDSAAALKLWRELMGEAFRLNEVSARQAWDFRSKLARVPKLHGKSVFKDLTAAQAIARADAIERGEFVPDQTSDVLRAGQPVARLSKKTQNKHLDFFVAFYKWEGLSDYKLDKPFSGTLHKKREIRRDAVETRTALDDEFQVRLFSSPVWRGSVSVYFRTKRRPVEEGGVIIRDALFWLPLLATFQGLRLTETLQLFVADVLPAHGTHWICIRRGPGRRVKTEASLREIPLHPELRRVGFIAYVEQQRAAGQLRLFPKYAPDPNGPAHSHRFSKNFGYYRRKVGCGELWQDLHAERHTVDTVLIRAKVPSRLVASICGHEGGHLEPRPLHMTNKLYFGGYQPEQLIDAINRIQYRGLDLRHLYPDAALPQAEAAE